MRRDLALTLFVAFAVTADLRASDLPRVEGTVVDAVTGQPVKKAAVSFQRAGQGPPTSYVVLTDGTGHFAFAGFAAGDWGGSVQREGYVDCWEIGTGSDAKPLRWRFDAETVIKDLTIRLIPTGVIAGRVVDADDEPVVAASVALTGLGAKARGQQFPEVQTNDLGEYRLYNIPSGKYIITATYQPRWQNPNTRLTQASGERYITTYYPSTADRGQATPVAVGMGALVQGVQIRLVRGSVVRVRGQVMQAASAGTVSSQRVFVDLSEAQEGTFGRGRAFGAMPQPDGVFEFNGVPPGRYLVRGRSVLGTERLQASTVVDVGDTDVDGIQLILSLPVTISGQVTVEGEARLPKELHAALTSRSGNYQDGALTVLRPDGSFTLGQVYEGRYDFMLQGLQNGETDLYVRSVRFANEDALSEGLHVGQGQQGEKLDVILSDDGATLACHVVSDKGEPVRRVVVHLIPDEPRNRLLSLYGQTWIGDDGVCKMRGVAPGSYRAFAFTPEQQVDVRHADELKPYEKFAKQVRFAPKETVQLQLQVIPAPAEPQ